MSVMSFMVKEALAGQEIGYVEWVYLLAIGDRQGCSIKDICIANSMDKGQATKVIRKLICQGYVEDGSRGKAYVLNLTGKGRLAYAYCCKIFDDIMSRILQDLTDEQRKQLEDINNRLNCSLKSLYRY